MSPSSRSAQGDATAVVVLAAGAGSRFGGAKQLALVDGKPALTRVLDAADGLLEEQVVVLGAHADSVAAAVPADRWRTVTAADWEAGVGASLRAGLRALPDIAAALIVLGDLPWLRREAIERILDAATRTDAEAIRAFEGTEPGHPVLLRGQLLSAAREAPDEGLAKVLRTTPVARVDCTGLGATRDLDHRTDLPA